ncbi:MAG: PAS domain-containing protein, partial [Candidatus Aminicenantales bacterium]
FRDFAIGFNTMTGRLKDMFGEIRVQNEEIRSILASIRDGLCFLDGDARIVLCNTSFRRIAGSDAPEGRHFWEVVRSSTAARSCGTPAARGPNPREKSASASAFISAAYPGWPRRTAWS